jgi:diketogulonate reductase-like aldo/keto reductase
MAHSVSPILQVNGVNVPSFFYGTAWKEERTEALTALALQSGFRAFDTANQRRHYVEAAVGDAIAGSDVARPELFLQSKFTHVRGHDQRLPYDRNAAIATQVAQSFQSSLEHLRTRQLDSYLLHGPLYASGIDNADWQVWRTMEGLVRERMVRLIGISNVSPEQLQALLHKAELKPAFVQNRCYARTGWDRETRELCRAHDIVYQGFSLLTANQRELARPPLKQIIDRSGRTLAQVVFRFALQIGIVPLTGTSDHSHMRADLDCFEFELSDDEIETIEHIAGG